MLLRCSLCRSISNNRLGKKLKRRLEDLERRAGSSSASPPQTYAEVKPSSSTNTHRKSSSVSSQQQSSSQHSQKLSPRSTIQHNALTPPLSHDDDLFSLHNFSSSSSSGAHTPPLFGYSGYPSPEADFSLYPAPSYQTTSSAYPSYPAYRHEEPQYAYMSPPQQTMPTLPSMAHFEMPVKKEDMGLNPFSMSYASMAGLDMNQNQYDDGTYSGDSLSL